MKKKLVILVVILFGGIASSFGQTPVSKDWGHLNWSKETKVIRCSDFHITKPLWEIVKEHANTPTSYRQNDEEREEEHKISQTFRPEVRRGDGRYASDQSIVQRNIGTESNRAPIQNWAGQTANGFRPFDPSGAVGPNHYIQMINATTYKIWDKNGNFLLQGTFGDLWNPPTGNNGDPIVLYDKDADRWFMSQFGNQTNKKIYIAISVTSDPTGQWYTYTFTSPDFPDYLKFSAWQDGYYMTANYNQKIFAFNRAKMLAGDGSAEAVYKAFNPPQEGFFVPLPADASDGTMPGAGTPCPIICYQDDGWNGVNTDAINIYEASVDWNALNMQVNNAASLPTNAFDSSYDPNWNDIPQPGTNQKLDGIGGAMMFRAQWKQWQNYNSIVVSWAVKVSNTQRGIFWAELRQDANGWQIYQQGIYAPGNDYYWMSSIAMNDNGDIALCYAKGSSNTFMSLAYTGRHANDPLGQMTIAEEVAQAGQSAQTNMNRDGDYAQTTLDPDGITFWHTGEYMASGGNAGTRVYSFRLPVACTPPSNQATNFSASNIGDNQMDISWTRGNGDRVLVVAHQGSAVDQDPASGSSYTANATFGNGDQIGTGNFVVYDGTGTSVTVTGLNTGTTYYFAIYEYVNVNHCYNTNALTGNATTTGVPPCNYCITAGNTTYQTSTTNVTLNTINNSSGKPAGYNDYTNISTDVSLGANYNLSVRVDTDGPYTVKAKVWIDWNQDCDFDDVGEEYNLGEATDVSDGATSNSPLSVTVPSDARLGNTRMRVITKYNNYATSCESNGFDGEVEDYTVNVVKCDSRRTLTWDGVNWKDNNGSVVTPDITRSVIVDANYTTSNGNIEACSMQVNSNKTLTITANHYVKIQNDIQNDGKITIKNKGILVQTDNDASIAGNGIYKIKVKTQNFVDEHDYAYWSIPITAFNLSDIVTNAWRYYSFDADTQSWNFETGNNPMTVGKGYAISGPNGFAGGTIAVNFTKPGEKFNTGIIQTPVVINGTGAQDDDDWNLIGNPFPSPVDFNAFATDNPNIQGSYYLWTNCAGLDANGQHQISGYTTYSVNAGSTAACNGDGPSATQFVPVAEGFYVEANAGGNVEFKNSQRSTTIQDFINRLNSNRVWLHLTNNVDFQQILIGFFDNATDGKDRLYDAHNIDTSTFGFYSLINQEKFAIQGLSAWQDNDRVIPLGFTTQVAGDHHISIDRTEGILSHDVNIYLHDLYNDSMVDLKQQDYGFQAGQGTYNDRFELIFTRNSLGVNDLSISNGVNLLSNKGLFTVISKNKQIKSVKVYSLDGKQVLNKNIKQPLSQLEMDLRYLSHQILIFKIKLDDEKTTVLKGIR